jgi:two-component system sensor histidine kinase UhpB
MSDSITLRSAVKWEDFGGVPINNSLVRILAVDDNEALRYSLVRSLREAGYQVIEARTGAEALNLVKQVPDLVTLDVNLPDMHGFDVCKQIKTDPLTAHIPILHLSSTFVDPDARVQGLASGADAYLAEPIDRIELVATVAALLRLKNAETMARQQAEAAEQARQQLSVLNANLEQRVVERTSELEAANESLRALSIRILQAQDEERKRIARELHDSVGQLLAAIKMNTASLTSESSQLSPNIVNTISDIEKMTDESLRSIRLLSHLLHPPLLDESGLLPALRWYIEEFNQRSGIMVQLECDSIPPRFSSEIETSLFRIVQECLGNIHRHSGSKTALIRLSADHNVIHLEVQDFGRGIPHGRVRDLNAGRGGVGIRGMQERVVQFGGAILLESRHNGTTVKATVPLRQQGGSAFDVA